MAIPQIGTPLGSLFVTAFLWFWTLKRARAHLSQQEVILRNQNRFASWSFFGCMILQMLPMLGKEPLFRVSLGAGCAVVFLSFILLSEHNGEGFWSKKRNQFIAGCLALMMFGSLPFLFEELYLIPLLTAMMIANICQRRFVRLFSSSLRDLEALQAKLLRQEAIVHNQRHKPHPDNESPAYSCVEKALESRA